MPMAENYIPIESVMNETWAADSIAWIKNNEAVCLQISIKGARTRYESKTAQMILVTVSVGTTMFVVLVAGIFGIIPLFSWDDGYGDPYNGDYSYYDNDLPPLWCDGLSSIQSRFPST